MVGLGLPNKVIGATLYISRKDRQNAYQPHLP